MENSVPNLTRSGNNVLMGWLSGHDKNQEHFVTLRSALLCFSVWRGLVVVVVVVVVVVGDVVVVVAVTI